MALSPDGLTLAFVGNGDGGKRLWIRPLDSQDARPVPGTAGAAAVTWSPDGRWLAFTADGRVKKTAVSRRRPRHRDIQRPDSRQLTGVGSGRHDPLHRRPGILAGSVQWRSRAASRVARDRRNPRAVRVPARWPSLPRRCDHQRPGHDRHLCRGAGRRHATRVLPFAAPARYAMGNLLFVRDRVLYAQPFDLSGMQLAGEAHATRGECCCDVRRVWPRARLCANGRVRPNRLLAIAMDGIGPGRC